MSNGIVTTPAASARTIGGRDLDSHFLERLQSHGRMAKTCLPETVHTSRYAHREDALLDARPLVRRRQRPRVPEQVAALEVGPVGRESNTECR